jgi:hypothetical protein
MFGKTHMPHTPPRTVAEVEGFVSLLLVPFQLFVTNPVGSAETGYRGQASYLC